MRSSDEKGKDSAAVWGWGMGSSAQVSGLAIARNSVKGKKAEHSGKHASCARCGGGNSQKFSSVSLPLSSQ